MKDYNNINFEQLASDDFFIQWCVQPNKNSNLFWDNWCQNNPDKRQMLHSAKQMVLDLKALEVEAAEGNFEEEIWNAIEGEIIDQPIPVKNNFWTPFSIAASLVFVIGLSFLLFKAPEYTLTTNEPEWINLENNSGLSKEIKLADGSQVFLEPFSSLKYPSSFSGRDQRVVFLQGEAFFDIERDTLKPFLIFANETITKVLGTSFTISAFQGEKTVEVKVKTGKVAVYAQVESEETEGQKKEQIIYQADEEIYFPKPNKKVDVIPNQKVVFDLKKEELIKSLVKLPEIIKDVKEMPKFVFKNEPVASVFEALEEVYGIQINYTEKSLKYCTINTRLDNEPLFQKLTIICAALNLSFTQKDGKIFIEGEGC